jgi:integrase
MEINPQVDDWLSARAESPSSRHSYLDHWNIFLKFCQTRGKNPHNLVNDFRAVRLQGEQQKEIFLEEWQDLLRAFMTYLKKKNYASMSVAVRLAIVRSFVKYWKIPLEVDLPQRTFVTYHNRDITKAEIKKILSNATLRDRAVLLMLVESGMRIGCCASLKYWQIKEDYERSRVPMQIKLPSQVLKDKVGDRFTFIGQDGFTVLQEYLQTRPPFKDDDYVFQLERSSKNGDMSDRALSSSISTKFNRAVQKLGIDKSAGKRKPKQIRLHGLRKYFFNNMNADSDYKKFWMGHSIGVEQHYISRNVEEHRKKYADGYQYLRLGTPSPDEKLNLVEAVMKENAELKKKQMETEAELEKAKMTLSMMEGTLGTVTPDMVDWLKKQVKKQQLSEEQLKGEEKAQS